MFHAHSNRSKYLLILSQHTTQAQHIGWSIWIVIIKTLQINWVNNAIDTQLKEEKAKDIPIVCEYRDFFLGELSGLLVKRNWF